MSSTTLALPSASSACYPLNRSKKKTLVSMGALTSFNNNTRMMMMTTSTVPPLNCYSTTSSTTTTTTIATTPSMIMIKGRRKRLISCELASATSSLSSTTVAEGVENKIGARVRVKVPLKVYHVPRVPELDLSGKEGHLKQYVALWKGKRISANLPYKVEFVVDIEGRGPVKFFAHLKEDEFDFLD